jgi:hypothetical protein
MARHTFVAIAAVAVAMLVGAQPAHAQVRYDFKVPFAFTANGKAFAAGEYAFSINHEDGVVTLQSRLAKEGSAILPLETRISAPGSLIEPEVVFDKVHDKYFVSELLIPGDDGYLLLVTKAKHTHESVKGARAKT